MKRFSFSEGCFLRESTYEKFQAAYLRARTGKASKSDVIRFERNLAANLIRLMDEVRSGKYQPSPYREFIVHEPKTRTIHALPFRDRVLHQWYVCEFIMPFFVPKFIHDSYACIVGRGTHAAKRKTQEYLRRACREFREPYVLKLDIAGFFYNIDKDALFRIVSRKMKDARLRRLTRVLIFDGFLENSGIPIGNYTSQYFANIYMNELDQYVRRVLGCRFYLRYMDDFVAIVDGREKAWWVFRAVRDFVEGELCLKLNSKSCYFPAKYGIDFVGYRVFRDYVLIRKRAKIVARKIIREYERGLVRAGSDKVVVSTVTDRFFRRANSWLGHAEHADTYAFRRKWFGEYAGTLAGGGFIGYL